MLTTEWDSMFEFRAFAKCNLHLKVFSLLGVQDISSVWAFMGVQEVIRSESPPPLKVTWIWKTFAMHKEKLCLSFLQSEPIKPIVTQCTWYTSKWWESGNKDTKYQEHWVSKLLGLIKVMSLSQWDMLDNRSAFSFPNRLAQWMIIRCLRSVTWCLGGVWVVLIGL